MKIGGCVASFRARGVLRGDERDPSEGITINLGICSEIFFGNIKNTLSPK
jgi:hypothetical protein